MKRVLCFLFGHKPRGPIAIKPFVIYHCHRCKQCIHFDAEKDWLVMK